MKPAAILVRTKSPAGARRNRAAAARAWPGARQNARQRHLRLADRRDRRRERPRPLPAAPAGPRGLRHRAGSRRRRPHRQAGRQGRAPLAKGAGLESTTPVYCSRLGRVNAGWVTTFNEMAIVSENRVTAIPADFDTEAAALLGCAVTTGFGVDQQQRPAQDRPVDRHLRRGRNRAEHRAGRGDGRRMADHRRRSVRQPPRTGRKPRRDAPDQLADNKTPRPKSARSSASKASTWPSTIRATSK